MDELGRKISKIDWAKLQRQAKKVQASTASALKDLVMTDLENKVRAATADTTWGASSSDLMEIAQGTFQREDYALIMSIVWQRLGSSRWRCVYKALEVLRNLLMHGSSRCLEDARAAQHHIQTLEHYRYVDPASHRDEGENVRVRAALVVSMIADPGILEEEREKDKALRAKVGTGTGNFGRTHGGGFSSDDYRYGSRGSGTGGAYGGPSAHGPPVHTSFSGGRGASANGAAVASSRNGRPAPGYSEEASGGYDDEPRGAFGALARKSAAECAASAEGSKSSALVTQNIDDLLGDGPIDGTASSGAAKNEEEDDDDDFNPRAASGSSGPGGANVDLASQMLAGLEMGGSGTAAMTGTSFVGAGNTEQGAVPMSQLVKNLASQAAAAPGHVAEAKTPGMAEAEAAGAADCQKGAARSTEDSAYGGLVRFDNILLDKQTRVEPKHSVNGAAPLSPPPVSPPVASQAGVSGAESKSPVKKEVDPFADLLSTAKKSGVL